MKTSTKKTPSAPALARPARSIPPAVCALASFANESHGVSASFRVAWANAPAVIRGLADPEEREAAGTFNRYCALELMLDGEVEDSRRRCADSPTSLAKALDILELVSVDYRGQLLAGIAHPSFDLGLAIGLMLTLGNGGAR